jgi:putative hydrolase of the HAD superfamily
MPVRAVTIDFWNTLVVASTGGDRRQAQRMRHLGEVVRALRAEATDSELTEAYRAAADGFHVRWKRDHITPTTDALVAEVCERLRVELAPDVHAGTVSVFERGLLHGPPDFPESLADALAALAERVPLGIISDTMFSPGRVIKEMLEERGVLKHFGAFVFSDETGFAKPDPRAFEQAAQQLGVAPSELLHIGDLRRTDVAGVQGVGGVGVLYTGIRDDPDRTPDPDATLAHWRDAPALLDRFA